MISENFAFTTQVIHDDIYSCFSLH
jgi:hypothetical protein